MDLATELLQGLEIETSFVIPIFGGIPIPESVFITWVIMAILVILSICLVRNLKITPTSRVQIFFEVVIDWIYNFFLGLIGEKGRKYVPYLGTLGIYILFANLSGLVGQKPPTKDFNVTAALAIMSIVFISYVGIKDKKMKGWLKHFAQPSPIIAPLNVLELIIRPLSLCMRLFGNVMGAFVVMELIKIIMPVVLPVPFSLYFDIFDGAIQTYVFVLLTSLFAKEAME